MKRSQGVLIIIFVVHFQCSQSALHHFNPEHHQNTERPSKKYHTSFFGPNHADTGGSEVDKLSTEKPGRVRRQNVGGNPQAYTSELSADTHQYAQPIYVGEGSKVSTRRIAIYCYSYSYSCM